MPLSWIAGNKWLENYPYRITLGWWMFAVAGGFVIMISLMTICYQAIRAARANPVVSLKAE
jgi:putative ABC transport system permease protein